jgi:hypothetical protein
MAETNTILVAGASGVIGAEAVEHFAALPGWRVIGASRRAPDPAPANYEHVSLDLMDPAACREAAARFEGVTHVAYAALYEKPSLLAGWLEDDQMQTNLAMMRNLMDPLLARARDLRHVSVLQGTKAYGAHVHPIQIPARENRPRDRHANFYWLQEDYIRAQASGGRFSFTIWRPQVVFGGAVGVYMNLIPIIGAYGAICRELGLPFYCPGENGFLIEAVDAELIARGLAAYGLKAEVLKILTGLFDASVFIDLHRLPELFCGFARRPGEGPTLYPVACSPQDWAAGAVFLILESCLGIGIQASPPVVLFRRSLLPESLPRIQIKNLQVGPANVDLSIQRAGDSFNVTVLRKHGEIDIVAVK